MILNSKFPVQRYLPCTQHMDKPAPEHRLYLAMLGSLCLPISLFWFGWAVDARVHWICPVIAEGLFGCRDLLIFMAASQYMVYFYG